MEADRCKSDYSDTGGRDERRSNNRERYASDYQPASDALGTDKEEEWTRV